MIGSQGENLPNSKHGNINGDTEMTKEMLVKMVKDAKDGTVEVVCKTSPKLNKFARARGADGKRIPCPFAKVEKVSRMKIDIATRYVGEEEDDNNHIVDSWTKPTKFAFLKESVKTPGKFYLWGRLVDSVPEWKADGNVVDRKVLSDYLPVHKNSEAGEDVWLKIDLANLS